MIDTRTSPPNGSRFAGLLRKHPFGFFADPETLRPLPDDEPIVCAAWLRDGRNMRLLAPVVFVDPNGNQWRADTGRVINGISSPRFCWRIQPPYVGRSRDPSVIHDVLCEDRPVDSDYVHWVFWCAMRAVGVPPRRAERRWRKVVNWGPRFKGAQERRVRR